MATLHVTLKKKPGTDEYEFYPHSQPGAKDDYVRFDNQSGETRTISLIGFDMPSVTVPVGLEHSPLPQIIISTGLARFGTMISGTTIVGDIDLNEGDDKP